MKRTKETFFREHPEWQERQGVSGLREFDGEDLRILGCDRLRVRCAQQVQQGPAEAVDLPADRREAAARGAGKG